MKLLPAANNSGSYSMIFIIIIMFALMYFTMYRPQKKQQQQRQEMLNQIKVGDPVVTIGGLHGVIDSMNDTDKTVVLDCDGIYLTFSRSAIRTVSRNTAAASANSDSAKAETKEADTQADSEAKPTTAPADAAEPVKEEKAPTTDAPKADNAEAKPED